MMKALKSAVAACVLAAVLPVASLAQEQDQTLADIRQDLAVLYAEIQRLKGELNTTGAPNSTGSGGSVLDRVVAIEAALQGLTGKTEELEHRINRITRDGTNRVGDLEFRLCELEPHCDIASLGDTPSLGGIDNASAAPEAAQPVANGPLLAVGEQADFERAQAAMNAGDFRAAADQFAAFAQTYPGGPLSTDAHYLRGEAFESLGEMTNAARAYLDAFSGDPTGARAPDALFKLGMSLGSLGQQTDACITLGEVTARFPNSDAALDAQSARANLGCS